MYIETGGGAPVLSLVIVLVYDLQFMDCDLWFSPLKRGD